MLKTDATEHLEEIVAFDRPRLHSSRITQLSPPLGWLVREAEDTWRFVSDNGGTRVERTFSFELTSPIWSVLAAPLMHAFLRVAVRRDLENIGRTLSLSPSGSPRSD